jgi:hypothetical protein
VYFLCDICFVNFTKTKLSHRVFEVLATYLVVLDPKLIPQTEYSGRRFRCFPQSLQENAGTVPSH